jgi:hypothetical protein
MNRPSPAKLALLDTSWLRMGSTQPASPDPRLLTALCLAGRGASLGSIAAEPGTEALAGLWRRVEDRSSFATSQRASAGRHGSDVRMKDSRAFHAGRFNWQRSFGLSTGTKLSGLYGHLFTIASRMG